MADLARRATRWVGTFPYILTPIPNLYDHSFPKTRTNTQTHTQTHKQTDMGITIPRPPPMGGEVKIPLTLLICMLN